MQNTIILKSLNSLKQRLSKANNKLNLQNEQGNTSIVTCSFNSPVEQSEIESFENNNNWTLPIDYKFFLQQHNGARIFEMLLEGNINIGGGIRIFSLNEIEITHNNLQLPKDVYPIAHVHENYLVVDNSKVISNIPDYLLLGDDILDLHPLHSNFEIFLDRYIVSQGSSFWRWNTYTAAEYYKINTTEN
ncbi:SMI1/KNR4 family protein [Bacillus bombysepticus]|uniref:SMI1/KNR4 family protein n=1 Tax=Bacillus bombysepticus TaxID=658666 RepID=UPI003018C2DA